MSVEFKKITDVELAQTSTTDDTVLIERDGMLKRAPKNLIGAQSDWNEKDETSPAFIKNKPEQGSDSYMIVLDVDPSDGSHTIASVDGLTYEILVEMNDTNRFPDVVIRLNMPAPEGSITITQKVIAMELNTQAMTCRLIPSGGVSIMFDPKSAYVD